MYTLAQGLSDPGGMARVASCGGALCLSRAMAKSIGARYSRDFAVKSVCSVIRVSKRSLWSSSGAVLGGYTRKSKISCQLTKNVNGLRSLGGAYASFASDAKKGKKKQKNSTSADPASEYSEKEAALQSALAQIKSSFGDEAVMWLGRNTSKQVPVVSTGSLALDVALGVGGLPKGRVVEIYGPEASGKTTLALHVIAEAQKQGGRCVFIDAEHALDKSLAEAIGIDIDELLVAQPDCGENALAIADTLVRSGSVDVLVVDSVSCHLKFEKECNSSFLQVAALVPRVELEGEMGDSHMALLARLMSQALRKLTHSLSRSQTILIFINQIRSKLASFGGFGGAPIEVTSGGNALKFYASVRLNIRRTNLLKKGDETVGAQVLVKIAKNKLAPPFRTAEFEIDFGRGISKEGEVLDLGFKHGLVGKSGNWYTYNSENIANGKENAKKYLREHPDILQALSESLREILMGRLLEQQGDAGENETEVEGDEDGSLEMLAR
ncbi:uncharacterized protein LOC112351093 isoform X1 [Selaginella moellendorffii]|uniref:uncharacterized protein LOC112351093 isoform X1 n=1 Tax=Selaginella moellendorffii TaxID=88036 RepID=UPI000D1C8B9D|nr:uncharacterized protein LOC112351093 isoform X1 [Selaginella moellendorffii]|eukprot:XP_024544093.1 uncharacterized protein LOC112351093 isoform X1 [Selaginella moellendorffii]